MDWRAAHLATTRRHPDRIHHGRHHAIPVAHSARWPAPGTPPHREPHGTDGHHRVAGDRCGQRHGRGVAASSASAPDRLPGGSAAGCRQRGHHVPVGCAHSRRACPVRDVLRSLPVGDRGHVRSLEKRGTLGWHLRSAAGCCRAGPVVAVLRDPYAALWHQWRLRRPGGHLRLHGAGLVVAPGRVFAAG